MTGEWKCVGILLLGTGLVGCGATVSANDLRSLPNTQGASGSSEEGVAAGASTGTSTGGTRTSGARLTASSSGSSGRATIDTTSSDTSSSTGAAVAAATTSGSTSSGGISLCDACLQVNYGPGGACNGPYGTCEADSTCSTVESCFTACSPSDTACQSGCFRAASSPGPAEFQALATCLCGTCTAACASDCSGMASGAVDCCGGVCGASGATCDPSSCQCIGGTAPVDAGGTSSTGGTTSGGGSLTVTVTTASGPVAGAWVNIDAAHQGTSDANGNVQLSSSPAPPFVVAVTAPYCAAVYQTISETSTTLPITMSCGLPTPNTDQIDMSQVTVYDSPPDTPGWPVTTAITELDLDGAGGMYINFTKRDGNLTWPNVSFGGGGSLEYTLWSVEFINGQWAASGPIEYWQGDEYSGGDPNGFAVNWYYDGRWGPLQGYQPAVGELVGFFVSAGNARNVLDDSGTLVLERSNVLLVPFPSEAGAVYFVDGPCGGLPSGESLGMGQALTSCDGRFTLTMENGGLLSLDWGGGHLWDDGQDGHPTANVYMQTDGNLVSYYNCGSNGGPIWNAGSGGNPGATLVLDNGGNLSVQLNGTILWQTNTGGH